MRNVVSAGDFNFFTATKLEAMGGSPALKKKSVINIIKIREGFELCNIWRTRNPSSQRYTFRHKHFLDLTQQRLYITCSFNRLLAVTLTESKSQNFAKGNNFLKFKSLLI